ncbi:MAG: hypothetical protein IJ566_01830 [Cardiobacteriaceae bacterium]|nr:hypothetical protein [Cardiobacteriaceae bacterium]
MTVEIKKIRRFYTADFFSFLRINTENDICKFKVGLPVAARDPPAAGRC